MEGERMESDPHQFFFKFDSFFFLSFVLILFETGKEKSKQEKKMSGSRVCLFHNMNVSSLSLLFFLSLSFLSPSLSL